ncbi:MAG: hypothetical protein ACXW3X_16130 [Rhodoplanes sp.]
MSRALEGELAGDSGISFVVILAGLGAVLVEGDIGQPVDAIFATSVGAAISPREGIL